MAEYICAMCTHAHQCELTSISDNDPTDHVWLCSDCAAYVEDDDPWSATQPCQIPAYVQVDAPASDGTARNGGDTQ